MAAPVTIPPSGTPSWHQMLFDPDSFVPVLGLALVSIVLFPVTPAIVRRSFQHRRVTYNTLFAGITAYLVIGLWFGAIFRGVSALENYQFFDNVVAPRVGDYIYFSFETLTTLGYGDLAPVSDAGRTFAILEAILGQIFLVTAVARIVSLLGSDRGPLELPGDAALDRAERD